MIAVAVFNVELIGFHADASDSPQRSASMVRILGMVAPDPFELRPVGFRWGARRQAEGTSRFKMRPHIFHRTLDIPGVHRAALRLVAVKQVLVGLTLEHGSKLPTQIMRVLNTTGETETAGRRMPMRRVTDQEYPPLAEFRRQHTLYRPARDLVDGHRKITDAKRQAHVLFDLLVRKIFRTFALIGDVEYPFFAVRAPMVGTHGHEHRHLADRGTPNPADQHVRIVREFR